MKIINLGNHNLLQLDDYHCIVTGFEKVDNEHILKVNVCENLNDLDDQGYNVQFKSSTVPQTIDFKDYQQLQLDRGIVVNIYKLIDDKYLIGEESDRDSEMYIEHEFEVINTYDNLIEYVKTRYNRKTVKSLDIS